MDTTWKKEVTKDTVVEIESLAQQAGKEREGTEGSSEPHPSAQGSLVQALVLSDEWESKRARCLGHGPSVF